MSARPASDITGEAHGLAQARAAFDVRIVTLVQAWDVIKLCAPARFLECLEQLREARRACLSIGDVAALPCPLPVWTAALGLSGCWMEADREMREGPLRGAVEFVMRALLSFAAETAAPERVRRARAAHETADDF